MATENEMHPWRIYGKEYEVPESKMGKGVPEKSVIGYHKGSPIYAHEHSDLLKLGRMEGLRELQNRHSGLGISEGMKIMRNLRGVHGASTASPDPGFGQGRGSGAGDVAPSGSLGGSMRGIKKRARESIDKGVPEHTKDSVHQALTGQGMPMYRGTKPKGSMGYATDAGKFGHGTYLTSDKGVANWYSNMTGNVSQHHVKLKNPLVLHADEARQMAHKHGTINKDGTPATGWDAVDRSSDLTNKLKQKGHDGVAVLHPGGSVEVNSFHGGHPVIKGMREETVMHKAKGMVPNPFANDPDERDLTDAELHADQAKRDEAQEMAASKPKNPFKLRLKNPVRKGEDEAKPKKPGWWDQSTVTKADEKKVIPGGRGLLGVKTEYTKPGESFSGGPVDTKKLKTKLGEHSPTREKMDKADDTTGPQYSPKNPPPEHWESSGSGESEVLHPFPGHEGGYTGSAAKHFRKLSKEQGIEIRPRSSTEKALSGRFRARTAWDLRDQPSAPTKDHSMVTGGSHAWEKYHGKMAALHSNEVRTSPSARYRSSAEKEHHDAHKEAVGAHKNAISAIRESRRLSVERGKSPNLKTLQGVSRRAMESSERAHRSFEDNLEKFKSISEKAYPLGEGPKKTQEGVSLWLKPSGEKKEEKKFPVDLGTSPKMEAKPVQKSLQKLEEMAKSVAPSPTDLLKACKACMEKAESEKKAYLGEVAIPSKPGAKPMYTGEGIMPAGGKVGESAMKPGAKEKVQAKIEATAPVTTGLQGAKKSVEKAHNDVCPECGKKDCPCAGKHGKGGCKCPEAMDKAIGARSVPRLPRAMVQEMIRRNAQSVMTRGNSRFAKDIHTGPLTGETVKELEEDAARRTGRFEVFKSCDGCGRRYKMFKGIDSGCPTCSVNKSSHCGTCGSQLLKSHGGSVNCPLCG